MSRTLVPVQIDPHLAAFLYTKFQGSEAHHSGKKVKTVKIHTSSVIGRYIRMMVVKSQKPPRPSEFNFCLSIKNRENKKFDGTLYNFENGEKSFLKIPEEFNRDLNDMLQNIFETALFYYVEGFRKDGYLGSMRDGLRSFIDQYDLYEFGYSFAALEQIYLRAKRNNEDLSKLHRKRK